MKIDDFLILSRADFKILIDNQCNLIQEYPDGRRIQLGKGGGGSVTSVNGETGDVIITIPVKLSELTDDVGYAKTSTIMPLIDQKANSSDIPTDNATLKNGAGYAIETSVEERLLKKQDIATMPKNLSDFKNDVGFVNKDYVDGEVAKKASVADIPDKTSDLTNDSGFITDTDLPSKLSPYAKKTYVDEKDGEVKRYAENLSAGKLTNPPNGKAGQFLMKTNSGVAWADCSGGGGGGVSEIAAMMTLNLDNPIGGGAPAEGISILKIPRFAALNENEIEYELNTKDITNPIEA